MYGPRLTLNGTGQNFANAIISLAARDNQGPNHNPAILQYVPFTFEAMSQIAAEMPLHGDTVRIINRSDMAFYEDIDLTASPHKAICMSAFPSNIAFWTCTERLTKSQTTTSLLLPNIRCLD